MSIYQTVLLSLSYNISIPQLVHSFGCSVNSYRFRMMKQTDSNPLRKWAVFLVLPVLVVFLWVFSQPIYEYNQPDEDSQVVNLSGLSDSPLFFIDGKEVSYATVEQTDPNNIERIDVLKDETASEQYGEKAKNGVVLITMKK